MDVLKARMNRFTAGLLAGVTALALLLSCTVGIRAQAAEIDASWGLDYDSATEFFLRDGGDLYRFAQMVNEGKNFADKTVTMADDIHLRGGRMDPYRD